MSLIHIVLVKLKPEAQSGAANEQFQRECHALYENDEIKPLVKEMKWGKPVYTTRNQGYDWGLYSVFEDQAAYEKYRDHPVHRAFVADSIGKYTDNLLAYDFEI